MTDQDMTFIREVLKRIQADQASMHREMREDFREVKTRLTLLEQHFATHTVMQATQSGRIDRLEERLERVERRLELRDETQS